MKIFLAYSHKNESFREDFSRWITLLKDEGIVTEWYDRKLNIGDNVDEEIDKNMDDSDIIAFFVSDYFLDSDACKKEVKRGIRLKEEKGISIMPIILTPCAWEDSLLREYLACPRDGKPITDWGDENTAWKDIYEQFKKLIDFIAVKKKELKPEFKKFIENPGDFISSDRDEILRLENIFVPPMLTDETIDNNNKIDRDFSSKKLLKKEIDDSIILILGDEQSGKTALCQMLFSTYHKEDNFYPIYIDGENITNDNLNQIEKLATDKQYKNPELYRNIPDDKKIIIVDGLLKNDNLKSLKMLSLINKIKERDFYSVILLADNVFFDTTQWQQYEVKSNIKRCRIKVPGHAARAEIIKKWMIATQDIKEEDFEKLADVYREHINSMFVENNIPSYPFYVLTFLEIISSSNIHITSPQNITSYGHCYHALIVKALAKCGMLPEEVEVSMNLLTELAYYFYKNNKTEITKSDFRVFYKAYGEKFNIFINYERLKSKLIASNLLQLDLFGNFRLQEYVFYYFCAKYLAEKMTDDDTKEEAKEEIFLIFKDAHRKRSGNILLFLIHHAPKNSYLTGKMNDELNLLFSGMPEATLKADETIFFEDYLEHYSPPAIEENPSKDDRERQRQLSVKREQAQEEEDSQISEKADDADEKDGQFIVDFGKSLRIMRVVGQLVKTEQALTKEKIQDLVKNVEGLALRILSFGHNIMKENPEEFQSFIEIKFLKNTDVWEKMTTDEKKQRLRLGFGWVSLMMAHNMIYRSVHAIGSDKLLTIINSVTKANKNPATELINMASILWYEKKVDIPKIKEMKEQLVEDKHFMAIRMLQLIVKDHLYLHGAERTTREEISNVLNLPIRRQLLIEQKRRRDQ